MKKTHSLCLSLAVAFFATACTSYTPLYVQYVHETDDNQSNQKSFETIPAVNNGINFGENSKTSPSFTSVVKSLTTGGESVVTPTVVRNSAVDQCFSSKKKSVWESPGAHPYGGSSEYALHVLSKKCGVPDTVHQKWSALISEGNPSVEQLIPGTKFSGMMWSSKPDVHRLWSNVVMGDWNESYDRNADVYRVLHEGRVWVLVRPHICDNWAFYSTSSNDSNSSTDVEEEVSDEGPFNLYVQFLEKDSIPQRVLLQMEEIMPQESDETWAFANGSVSRNLGNSLRDSMNKSVVKGIDRMVSAEITHLESEWQQKTINPSTRFPGRTYWYQEIPRVSAKASGSWYGVRNIQAEGCVVFYPSKNMHGELHTLVNPKKGALSELAQSASRDWPDDGNTPAMALYVVLDCD